MMNVYDQYADAYITLGARRSETDFSEDPTAATLFELAGDVTGVRVLDAGCGAGFAARVLARGGADVTAVDISPRLVSAARATPHSGLIDYYVADLSLAQPKLDGRFDLVVSHLVLNDVPDYAGFIDTIVRACKPCGRIVLTLNNPYSAVLREKTSDYFDSGNAFVYQGLAESGVRVYYYHRTLEEYILAFRNNGMLLRTLQDVRPTEAMVRKGRPQAKWHHFPFLMVLEFVTTDSSLRSE